MTRALQDSSVPFFLGRLFACRKFNLESTLGVLLSSPTGRSTYVSGGDGSDQSTQGSKILLFVPQAHSFSSKIEQKINMGSIQSGEANGSRYLIVPFRTSDVTVITEIKIRVNGDRVIEQDAGSVNDLMMELQTVWVSNIGPDGQFLEEQLEKVSTADVQIDDLGLMEDLGLRTDLSQIASSSKCHSCPKRAEHYSLIKRKQTLRGYMDKLKSALADGNIELVKDYETRLQVLENLQYVGSDRTVQLKGRVASEINTCNSLIVTELIFENVLTELEVPEIVSLLSCLLFQEKSGTEPVLTSRVREAQGRLLDICKGIANVEIQAGLDTSVEQFIKENVNELMMQIAYEWANGVPFARICELSDVPEGSVVRTIIRLDETCRDVRNAARVIGDPRLYQIMTEASEKIRRDIVFAASLYVS